MGSGGQGRHGLGRGSEEHWADRGQGWGERSLESLQFRFGTGIPEQEVMGHRSDPGPSALEVTAMTGTCLGVYP